MTLRVKQSPKDSLDLNRHDRIDCGIVIGLRNIEKKPEFSSFLQGCEVHIL
jgi:hypothetical protein